MIQANISELKNRLSHYLRLVRGGETIEVVHRHTPLARIIGVGHQFLDCEDTGWLHSQQERGVIRLPKRDGSLSREFFEESRIPRGDGVTERLLQERENGR